MFTWSMRLMPTPSAQVVALDEPLDLVHLVHQLDREAERVDGPHRRTEAAGRSLGHALRGAAPLVEPPLGEVEVLRST